MGYVTCVFPHAPTGVASFSVNRAADADVAMEEGTTSKKSVEQIVATKMAVLNGMNLDESRLTEGLAPLGGVHVGAQDPFVVCFILV
jgi:hypothetical protein